MKELKAVLTNPEYLVIDDGAEFPCFGIDIPNQYRADFHYQSITLYQEDKKRGKIIAKALVKTINKLIKEGKI